MANYRVPSKHPSNPIPAHGHLFMIVMIVIQLNLRCSVDYIADAISPLSPLSTTNVATLYYFVASGTAFPLHGPDRSRRTVNFEASTEQAI